MRFIETPIFTKGLRKILPDEDYRALQLALLLRPEQGPIIPGTNGLRKLRWRAKGKGKRGGCRIIYFWDKERRTFYMLLAYEKSTQEDLTPQQLKLLSKLAREEFK